MSIKCFIRLTTGHTGYDDDDDDDDEDRNRLGHPMDGSSGISVTRWLGYFSIFGHLTKWRNFAKSCHTDGDSERGNNCRTKKWFFCLHLFSLFSGRSGKINFYFDST